MKFVLIEDGEKRQRVAWNKGIKKERPEWFNELNDDGKLQRHYSNKRGDAIKRGIEFLLSLEDYCTLMKKANIMSSQIGTSRDSYQLARFNDSGPYAIDNCRFIPQIDNARERKISDRSRENSRRSAAIMNANRPEDIGDRISNGLLNSEKNKARLQLNAERKAAKRAKMNPNRMGEKNSQAGSYWIHNDETGEICKWSDKKGPMPDGFTVGRKLKQQ